MPKPRVLLTTIFRPFSTPNKYNTVDGEKLLDYFSNRLTRESGMFSLHDNHPTVALHIVAANIDADVTVLETPTIEEFKAELEKGYDVMGISFLTLHFPKLAHMIALARKIAPQTKIVIGGFGTALYGLERLEVEGVSKKEGVHFMRQFLGQEVEQPIVHPLLTFDVRLRIAVQHPELGAKPFGIIVNGFGCPHGCEFCSTSAYFGRKHVPFVPTGADLYKLMKRFDENRGVRDFVIYEEDFYLYKSFIEDFIETAVEARSPYSYGCYSTVKALSQFPIEELVKSGLSHIWIGVESAESTFKKSEGRPIRDIFAELQRYGVTTTGSIIAGLDYHRKDNLEAEFEHLASLYPSTVQISNLIAGPGTPLRGRLEQENRLVHDVSLKDSHLYSDTIEHPEFGRGELTVKIFEGYEYIYQRLGPSVSRMLRTWFQGYQTLVESSDDQLRHRAEILKGRIFSARALFAATTDFLPNDGVRNSMQQLLDELHDCFGPLLPQHQAHAEFIRSIFEKEAARQAAEGAHVYEPPTRRAHYNSWYLAESNREGRLASRRMIEASTQASQLVALSAGQSGQLG